MHRFLPTSCLAIGLSCIGCSGDQTQAPADSPLPDASALDAEVDSDSEPEAGPDAQPDSLVEADTQDAAEGDAASCDGYVAKPFCDAEGCYTPVGCFMMGSPSDEPGHDPLEAQVQVTFDKMLRLWPHEVTLSDWTAEGFAVPSALAGDLDACTDTDCPVTGVTWFEAIEFAAAYSEHRGGERCYQLGGCTGAMGEGMVCETVTPIHNGDGYCGGYRVPTSAEWEYAARGGTTSAFYDGPNEAVPDTSTCTAESHLDSIGWYCDNAGSPQSTHRVGKKAANPLKLFDMSGNAAEWVSDSFPSQPLEPEPLLEMIVGVSADGPGQVRGGHAGSQPWDCRSASRQSIAKDARLSSVGFRLVQTVLINR